MSRFKLCTAFAAVAMMAAPACAAPVLKYDLQTENAPPTIGVLRASMSSLLPAREICAETRLTERFFNNAKDAETISSTTKSKNSTTMVERTSSDLKTLAAVPELTNYSIARLTASLYAKKKSDLKLLVNFYKHYDPEKDIQFKNWELSKRIELLRALTSDPFLVSAKIAWAKLNMTQRLEVATYVEKLHARIYGYEPAAIKRVWDVPNKNGSYNEAYYTDSPDEISVNTYKSKTDRSLHTAVYDNFEQFVAIIVHEGDHNFMHSISVSENTPRALAEMALIARLTGTDKNYIQAAKAGFDAYLTNPTEINANSIENEVHLFLKGTDKYRAEIERSLTAKQASLGRHLGILQKQIALENPDKTCAAFEIN